MMIDKIKTLAEEIHADVIQNRRHLHANPELSFEEYKTSAFVKAELDKLRIPYQELAGTGVVGILKGAKASDKVIALRGDMDALPITETNETDY